MYDSAIRHLYGSDDTPLVAAAFFESVVQIWSVEDGQKLGEFPTVLDFGGRRLALADGGNLCVAASWDRGLAAYSVPEGRILWHRTEFRQIQNVTCSRSGQEIFCSFDNGSTAVVAPHPGALLKRIDRAHRVICGRSDQVQLLVNARVNYHINGPTSFDIPPLSFGLRDAAFSEYSVCISEPRAGIRCIDLVTQRTLWHHESIRTNWVAFCSEDHEFYCVATTDRPPHDCSLIRLAPRLLDCEQVAWLGPCWEASFFRRGTRLITMRGEIYETASGKLIRQLEFPQREYPDPRSQHRPRFPDEL